MKLKGFTLIELLIVVAIIAILAAIAVPNFLEAQVRSKVARVKTDMRSISVALEAYSVDSNGKYPLGNRAWAKTPMAGGGPDVHLLVGLSKLTSPLAYMTSIPADPFVGVGDKFGRRPGFPPIYETFGEDQWGITGAEFGGDTNHLYGYQWVLYSMGPQREMVGPRIDRVIWVKYGRTDLTGELKYWVYDPTNGTISKGYVMRTSKGEFPD